MRERIYLFSVIVFLLVSPRTYAAFSLSVTPFAGGSSLRFGRVTFGQIKTEEVRIRVTSTTGVQYQVRQRLLETLRNDKGERLNPQVIISYTLRGSNTHGSLYQDTPYNLDTSERVLYTSSSQGSSDSFIVVYSVDGNKINVSGKFLGRIAYRLIPLGGKGREQEIIINLYLDTERKFDVSITTSSGSSKILKLSTIKKEVEGYLTMSIEGSLGEQYQIYQILEEPFKNERREPLAENIVKFSLATQKGTPYYSSPTYLVRKPLLVYSSNNQGEGDKVVIDFFIDEEEIEKLKSGYYRARLVYNIEAKGNFIKRVPVELELEVKSIFDIEVTPESRGGIYFRNLRPENSPIESEVYIRVKTNIGKPYQVIQRLASPLTNEKSTTIPLEFFTFRVDKPGDKPGRSLFPNYAPLKLGDMPVFISDGKGTPTEFRIIYSLQVPKDILAGDYFTKVSYSLLER